MTATQVSLDTSRSLQTSEPLGIRLPLRLALGGIAAAALAGWMALAVLHVDDDYRVTHLQGGWIAISEAARAGHLYPPFFDGEHYAGTRWMPMPILLNGFASALVGDPQVGGKLLAAFLMSVLLLVMFVVLRRMSCPPSLALALAAVVVTTETGLQAGTTIGGDLLPVVLQTGAVVLAAGNRAPRSLIIAGVMAGLAVTSKLNALWAFAAVITALAVGRRWRHAVIFAATSAATATIVLGTIQLLTGGRLSEHLLTFALAGVEGAPSLFRAPNQVLYNLLGFAPGTVVLLPFAAAGALLAASWRQLSIIHFSLGYALILLLAVYTDIGTGLNQLLDVVVLTSLAVGYVAGRAGTIGDARARAPFVLIVVVGVIWAATLGVVRTIAFDLRRVPTAGETPARAALAVAAMVKPGEEVLTEDPSIYAALGRQPLIMDAYTFTRLDRVHPEWVDPLIARINTRQFALVVLVVSLENRNVDFWWKDYHLGPRVANALRQSYRPAGKVGRYHLYRPVDDRRTDLSK